MYFDDGARTTRGMEARLLSPKKHTHAEHIYQEGTKGKRKKEKWDDQDHKGMTQECMTQECVHDVKRRTKRENVSCRTAMTNEYTNNSYLQVS